MRKRILNQINKIMPNKMLRRQKFLKRARNKTKHEQSYSQYSYNKAPRSSRFNRWQEYKRLNRSF